MADFPIEVVLSLTTGVVLEEGGFDKCHAFIEHVAGHPVWTHEMAEKSLWVRLSNKVFDQYPQLREVEPFAPPSREREALLVYLRGYVQRARERFGETLSVDAGTDSRTESPMASAQRIGPDKPVLAIVAKS